MSRRVPPVALILGAAAADTAGMHGAAFYLLLAAVPLAAVAALRSLGELLERPGEVATLQAALWGLCLALVVLSGAARGPALHTGDLPTLAASTLTAALAVLAVKASLWTWAVARPRLARSLALRATRA